MGDSSTSLVADVDCTAGGQDLCTKHGVKGYPTIKYGDPNDLQDYNGGRDFNALKTFADENLGPTCSVEHLDLCNEENKALIESFLKMGDDELDKTIKDVDDKAAKIEAKSKNTVEGLQKKIKDLEDRIAAEEKKKDDLIEKESKKIGIRMM